MGREELGDFNAGFVLRGIQDTLCRLEYAQRHQERILTRIEQKIGVLGSGMTPEDTKAAIAQLEADAKQVIDGMTELNKAADKLEGV